MEFNVNFPIYFLLGIQCKLSVLFYFQEEKLRGSISRPITSRSLLPVGRTEQKLVQQLQQQQSWSVDPAAAAAAAADVDPNFMQQQQRIEKLQDEVVDEETERLLREYLEQTERLGDARNVDRGRQSEALKAKLDAK